MTENEVVTPNRAKHLERLKKKYPEKSFADDEEIFGQIGEDYDQYDQEIGRLREDEEKFGNLLRENPRTAQFIHDMANGKSPWANYVRIFGPELREMLDDPDVADQIAEAEADYVERVMKSQELDEEYAMNIEQTLQTLRDFQAERGLPDEKVDEVMAALIGIVRDGIIGKFLPETLEMMLKAVNHDEDVAIANEEGEVAGRNARITEKLRKRDQGDGLAPLGGKNNTEGNRAQGRGIFDLANEAM